MIKAGVHLGHGRSKNHPSMKENIFGVRNLISIIDLTKTQEYLARALDFAKSVISKGGIILLVGTRPASRRPILRLSEETGLPYFVDRWIGGTLTNFKIIQKRIEYMENLEKEKASGGFEKYTKKERLRKTEEIEKLNKIFNGLRNLKKIPEALFVVDVTQDEIAVREAKKVKVPVIALVDTNANFQNVDYPIPANDDALPAIEYMVEKLALAIREGKKGAAVTPENTTQ